MTKTPDRTFTERMLFWYRQNRRDLPWRKDRDPYHIWISEIMLQQTRVEAVRGYYLRWMEALPDIKALAEADEEQVLKLWQGLGYYNRARNLMTAAREIMERYEGVFPAEPDKIRSLKGIGDYTAGAIASIAFNQKTPAVDGNVLRVMSRINADYSDIKAGSTKKKAAAQLAELYPDPDEEETGCGDFTQALIELGAMVCVPNGRPNCDICPAAEFCRAKAANVQMELPVKAEKKARRMEERTVFILTTGTLEDGRRMAVRKRPEEGLLANLAELPNVLGQLTPDQALQQVWEWGCSPTGLTRSARFKHIFSHVEWHMTGYYIPCGVCGGQDFQWVTAKEMEHEVPMPSAFQYFLDA